MKFALWIKREETMSSVLFNYYDNMRDVIKTADDLCDLFESKGLKVATDYETYENIQCCDVFVIIKD